MNLTQDALSTVRNLLRREIKEAVKAGENERYIANLNNGLDFLNQQQPGASHGEESKGESIISRPERGNSNS